MSRMLITCVVTVVLLGCGKDSVERQALSYIHTGLKFEVKENNLDSAMVYYNAAFNLPYKDETNEWKVEAAIRLADGYYKKAQDCRSTAKAERYMEEARILLAWMKSWVPDDGRTFVMEQMIVYDDTDWYWNEREKKLYRITRD